MSTIQVNVVTTTGKIRPVIVDINHDNLPDATVSHLLGWAHDATGCLHPDCVSVCQGTPMPSAEDTAQWRAEHPDILFMLGWYARVYPEAGAAEPGDAFRSGHLLCGAWMAVHR